MKNQVKIPLEKSLAKRRKSLYTEHRTSRLWFDVKVFYVFQRNHHEMSLFDATPITKNCMRLQFE